MTRPPRNRGSHPQFVVYPSWRTWELGAPQPVLDAFDSYYDIPLENPLAAGCPSGEALVMPSPENRPVQHWHKAPERAHMEAPELAQPPPPPTFLDSDGIPVQDSGLRVMHMLCTNERQPVVSADWASVDHATARREWKLTVSDSSGGTYFGITEACSFENAGRTMAFDSSGNFIQGFWPIDLINRTRANELEGAGGFTKKGSFILDRGTKLRIKVDLATQTLVIEDVPAKGAARHRMTVKIDGAGAWKSARLMVSLRQQGDSVQMHV